MRDNFNITISNEPCRETLCTNCAHILVCMYREKYQKAQNALEQASYAVPEEDGTKVIHVADLKNWLAIPQLECRFYSRKSNFTLRNEVTEVNSRGGHLHDTE